MARPGLMTHRKFRRFARTLGSPILARGVLEILWDTAYEAGEPYLGTAEDLAATVGWTEDPETLARALAEAGAPEGFGFIEPIDAIPSATNAITTYQVHDLWHHAPEYVRKRRNRELERQERVAPSAKRRTTAPRGRHWTPSPGSQTGEGLTPSPSPSPSPSRVQKTRATRARDLLAGEVVDVAKREGANGVDLRAGFDAFWDAFPKKTGKAAVWKWWQKRKPDAGLLATMAAALEWQRRQDNWLRDGGRYIPNPLTWLNAERWQDEPTRIPRMSDRTIGLVRASEEFLKP